MHREHSYHFSELHPNHKENYFIVLLLRLSLTCKVPFEQSSFTVWLTNLKEWERSIHQAKIRL